MLVNPEQQPVPADRGTTMPEAPGLEAGLLARTANGEQEAFEGLFRRFERPLYAYFYRMLHDGPAAEELVCDTMTIVWKNARTYRGEGRVSSWIFGIAHRLGLAAIRRRRPSVSLEEVAEMSASDGPEIAAERSDVGDRVRTAVATLPPEHREVVELTFFQGFSYQEIARILSVPVNTVKTRMFYARQKLRPILERAGVTNAT